MITRVMLSEADTAGLGIQANDFRDLGSVVVLAGPNGGGKSRYLTAIRAALRRAVSANDPSGFVTWTEAPKIIAQADVSRVTVAFSATPVPVYVDPRGEADPLFDAARNRETSLRDVATALFNASHQEFADDSAVQQAGARASIVANTLEALLGTSFSYGIQNHQPIAKLFGRPYSRGELSAGQHLLLAWAFLIHDEKTMRSGSVVFLDEPERHLHPSSALTVLQRLRAQLAPDGQLWIATHSPTIVTAFSLESVYLVSDNKARFAGTRLDEVMDGLLGGCEGRRAMVDCLGEAEQLSLHRYLAQALFPPDVAEHAEGDRQETQVLKLVKARLESEDRHLKILDYAAGKARFAAALASELPHATQKRLSYVALNDRAFDQHAEKCSRNVGQLRPAAAQALKTNQVSDCYSERRVDIVLMCNFLHEVPPSEWSNHFHQAALCLNEGGVLILMEDQEPSIGELPTREGPVVLSLPEFRLLFGSSEQVVGIGESDRLAVVEVSREVLERYNPARLAEALKAANTRAKTELKRLRSEAAREDSPQRLGRRHAFLAMLLASTELSLEQLAQ